MSIALFLWISVTVFLLGFWGWTSYILYLQKRGWKAFANKFKLRYRGNKLLDSPEVSGAMDSFQVSIFATDHGSIEGNSRRMMTTLEVSLRSSLPVPCAMASAGMVKIVEELGLMQEYRPEIAGWDTSYIARTREGEVLEAYLTPKRVEALSKLMKIKRAWVILIFGGDVGLLRIDTPDALEDAKKLNELVQEMLAAARILELEQGEDKLIMSKRRKDDGKQKVLRVDENVLNENFGLSLEEE